MLEDFKRMDPKDPADALLCQLQIAMTRVAMESISRATMPEQPSSIRNQELRLSVKAAKMVAELIKVRDGRQTLTSRTSMSAGDDQVRRPGCHRQRQSVKTR